MPIPIDLTGQRFGRLVVTKRHFERKGYLSSNWECVCDCGNIAVVHCSNLKYNRTKSCGCLHKEAVTKHGLRYAPEYQIWSAIKDRCYNEKRPEYCDYGGRNITMCDEWQDSFEAFYRDMGPRPSSKHSVERRDNDKGYCKENCYWASRIEQANNTRRNIFYEYNGISRTLAAWCHELGLNYATTYGRIHHRGWTAEEAFEGKRK